MLAWKCMQCQCTILVSVWVCVLRWYAKGRVKFIKEKTPPVRNIAAVFMIKDIPLRSKMQDLAALQSSRGFKVEISFAKICDKYSRNFPKYVKTPLLSNVNPSIGKCWCFQENLFYFSVVQKHAYKISTYYSATVHDFGLDCCRSIAAW